jgi:hypothetical protein
MGAPPTLTDGSNRMCAMIETECCRCVYYLFVDALLNLLDRLKGPYNLENVISPMNVHISEAIMIFQERGQIITSKVFN